MTMTADAPFRLGLVFGAMLLVVLLFLALLPGRRAPPDSAGPRRLPPTALLVAVAAVALVVIGGPLVLVMLPLFLAARRWGGAAMAVVAFLAFVTAGLAAAWNPGSLPATGLGAFGVPAQIASLAALAAVLSAAAAEERPRITRRGQPSGRRRGATGEANGETERTRPLDPHPEVMKEASSSLGLGGMGSETP
jgi:arabinofuranan 3-O-arabinosyltransferase